MPTGLRRALASQDLDLDPFSAFLLGFSESFSKGALQGAQQAHETARTREAAVTRAIQSAAERGETAFLESPDITKTGQRLYGKDAYAQLVQGAKVRAGIRRFAEQQMGFSVPEAAGPAISGLAGVDVEKLSPPVRQAVEGPTFTDPRLQELLRQGQAFEAGGVATAPRPTAPEAPPTGPAPPALPEGQTISVTPTPGVTISRTGKRPPDVEFALSEGIKSPDLAVREQSFGVLQRSGHVARGRPPADLASMSLTPDELRKRISFAADQVAAGVDPGPDAVVNTDAIKRVFKEKGFLGLQALQGGTLTETQSFAMQVMEEARQSGLTLSPSDAMVRAKDLLAQDKDMQVIADQVMRDNPTMDRATALVKAKQIWTGAGQAPTTLAQLLTERDQAARRLAERPTSYNQAILDAYDLKITREAMGGGGQYIEIDPKTGKVTVAQGVGGLAGVGTAVQNDARERIATTDEMLLLVNRVEQLAKPGYFGATGVLSRAYNRVVGQLGDLRVVLEKERGRALADPNNLAKTRFDPKLPAIDILINTLIWRFARVNDPSGRLSDQDYERNEQALGLRGILTSFPDAQARLGELRQMALRARTLYTDLLSQPTPTQPIFPNLGTTPRPAPAIPPAPAAPKPAFEPRGR